MGNYILKRVLTFLPILLIMSLVIFFIIQLPPGDYLTSYVAGLKAEGQIVDESELASLKERYGLDQPWFVQYFKWMANILTRFDFGYSFKYEAPVWSTIASVLPMTIVVSLVTMLFNYLVGIPIGIYSAVHQYSAGDYIFTSIGFFGKAMPNFLTAILFMFISFRLFGDTMLGLYSPGMQNAPWSWAKALDLAKHCVIPIIVIGMGNTCGLMRTMRSQMLDELSKSYVMTGKAKGMKAKAIRYKYCVRAAVNPIVSSVGWSLVGIFTGSTITAIVLNLPSMGRVMYDALINQDMYLAGSWLFIMAIVTVIGTFISDLLLAWLDPRARKEYLMG